MGVYSMGFNGDLQPMVFSIFADFGRLCEHLPVLGVKKHCFFSAGPREDDTLLLHFPLVRAVSFTGRSPYLSCTPTHHLVSPRSPG